MADPWQWEPTCSEAIHPFPVRSISLASTTKALQPEAGDMVPERCKLSTVARYPVVADMAQDHRPKPLARHGDRPVQPSAKFLLDFPEFRPQIKHIVQIDVGQQRTDAPALGDSLLAHIPRPILQNSGVEPLLDMAQHSFVRPACASYADRRVRIPP